MLLSLVVPVGFGEGRAGVVPPVAVAGEVPAAPAA
jgi:hypothetical protein